MGQLTEEEFTQFCRAMHPRLLRYAMRRLDVDTANDAAIDTLRVVWTKHPASPRGETELRRLQSLAFKIMKGVINNQQRAATRRARLERALVQELRSGGSAVPDVAETLTDETARRELFAALPVRDREVLALLLDGYSVKEIATILDCSPGAVSMRLARARDKLRTRLERQSNA